MRVPAQLSSEGPSAALFWSMFKDFSFFFKFGFWHLFLCLFVFFIMQRIWLRDRFCVSVWTVTEGGSTLSCCQMSERALLCSCSLPEGKGM